MQCKIKELRNEKEISMLDLATAIGVSDAAISNWENGINEPKASYLVRLADYFGCTTDYLLGREDDVGNVAVTCPNLSPKEQKLIDCYRSLSIDGKSAFLSMAENIAGMYRQAPKKS